MTQINKLRTDILNTQAATVRVLFMQDERTINYIFEISTVPVEGCINNFTKNKQFAAHMKRDVTAALKNSAYYTLEIM